MKILYLCDEYPPGRHGGIGTAVQLLARQMVQNGHTVVVAGFYDWGYGQSDKEDDKGVKVFRFRRGLDSQWFFGNKESILTRATYKLLNKTGILQWDIKRSLIRYGGFLESLIREYNIDIVEGPDFNEYVQYCKEFVAFPRLSVPTIVKLHTNLSMLLSATKRPVPSHFYQMDRSVLENASYITSVSDFIANKTRTYFDLHKPIVTVYNGILIDHAHTNIAREPYTVLYAGSFAANKGLDKLIAAWPIIVKAIPQAKLLVYGKGRAEHLLKDLAIDVRQSISISGHIPTEELHLQMMRASVAVFPSYFESFGLVIVEAMLCGAAVICSNRATGPELISDGVEGILVDPDDVSMIAEKVVFLLGNASIREEISKCGEQHVRSTFDIKQIAERNFEVYKLVTTDN